MNRFVVIDAPAEALGDLNKHLATAGVESKPFLRKAIGAAEGLAIACAAVNLVKIIWDWYSSWGDRQANMEVWITLYPDNVTLRLAPNRRTELEVLFRADRKPKNTQPSDHDA